MVAQEGLTIRLEGIKLCSHRELWARNLGPGSYLMYVHQYKILLLVKRGDQ